MLLRRKIGATVKLPVLLVDSTDGSTKKTGVTAPTVQISKNGGAFTAPSDGAWTELGNGHYTLSLNATDLNTVGTIQGYVQKADCLDYDFIIEVYENIESDVYGVIDTEVGAIKTKTDKLTFDIDNKVAAVADISDVSVDTNAIAEAVDVKLTAAHGAGIWGGAAGLGVIEFVYTVTRSDNELPIDGADIWVTTDATGLNVIASGATNQSGNVTFWLDPGIVYIWRKKAGFTFSNPDTEVIS